MRIRDSALPLAVWGVLCALSVVSVVQLKQGWSGWPAVMLVVLIAAVKARLVIRHYMEVTRAKPVWRLLYAAWTFAVAATIAIGYLLSLR